MPGPIYRQGSAEPSAQVAAGKLVDKDGQGTLWVQRGAEWFRGKSATPSWRQRGPAWFKAGSSEPHWRLSQGHVLQGNTYTVVWRVADGALFRPGGAAPEWRGPGLTADELVTAALLLGG